MAAEVRLVGHHTELTLLELLTELFTYAADGKPVPLILWGSAGSGKSTVMVSIRHL